MDYIYFVHDPLTEMVKIGFSQEPDKRFRSLVSSSPLNLVLLRVVRVSDGQGRAVEKILHNQLAPFRFRGEWFHADPELLDFAQKGDVPESLESIPAPVSLTQSGGLTLREVAEQADVPQRTVRYYISEGLIPGPSVMGKNASYSYQHVYDIQAIKKLQEQGLSLVDIKKLPSLNVVWESVPSLWEPWASANGLYLHGWGKPSADQKHLAYQALNWLASALSNLGGKKDES